MGLVEGNHSAGLEGHHRHMHVVTHVVRIDKAGGRPHLVAIRHHRRRDIVLVGDDGLGQIDTVDAFVGLAYPVETHGFLAAIAHLPVAARGDKGVAAGHHHMHLARQGQLKLPLDDKQHAFRLRVGLRTFTAALRADFHDVLGKGLGEPRQRP